MSDDLLGREQELAQLRERTASCELLTLVGPPGAGKTRLARAFVEGTSWTYLDLRENDGAFEDGPTLWVVDHCEGRSDVLHALLERGARILALSRTRLHLPGEHLVELAYLGCEENGAAHTLFRRLAQQLDPLLPRDELEASALAEIVQLLDGCPLAIEEVAPKVARLGVRAMLEHLQRNENVPERFAHAVASSWQGLPPALREALRGLLFFAGSWSLEDAAHVLGTTPAEAMALVEALRDRSLVQRDERRGGFCFYGVLRRALRSHAGELPAPSYRRLYEARVEDLGGRAFYKARDERNHELFFGLSAWALENARPDEALRAALHVHGARPTTAYAALLERIEGGLEEPRDRALCALARADAHDWLGEFEAAMAHAERAHVHCEALADAELQAIAYAVHGRLCGAVYREQDGMPSFERALTKAASKPALLSWVQQQTALFLLVYDPAEAERRIERALWLVRSAPPGPLLVQTLASQGVARLAAGSLNAADASIRECESLLSSVDDVRIRGTVQMLRAVLHLEKGELQAAAQGFRDALQTRQTSVNAWQIGLAELGLAEALLAQEAYDESEVRFHRALAHLRAIREKISTVFALCGLGTLRARQGALDEARRLFAEAKLIATESRVPKLEECVDLRAVEVQVSATGAANDGSVDWSPILQRIQDIGPSSHFGLRFPWKRLQERIGRLGETPPPRLRVGASGRWFALAGQDVVDLRRRKPLSRVLACLASHPGEWTEYEQLYACGWPGERCSSESQQNRVQVTLSRLRRLGLDGMLETNDGRVRLRPSFVERSPQEDPPVGT